MGEGFKVDPRTLDGWEEGDTERMGAHLRRMLLELAGEEADEGEAEEAEA